MVKQYPRLPHPFLAKGRLGIGSPAKTQPSSNTDLKYPVNVRGTWPIGKPAISSSFNWRFSSVIE